MASITESRPTHVRYYVLAALCMAAVVAYIHRGCLAVPKDSIRAALDTTSQRMDHILAAFFLGYAIFQIPSGWLADRFGTRKTLPMLIVIWSTAVGLMSRVDGPESLYLLHFINGMAQAGIFPCCVKSFSHWFPASERAFPNGMLASFMSVGGALATFLTGWMLIWTTWNSMLIYLALPGALFAIVFLFWFRDRPAQHGWVNGAERELIGDPLVPAARAETREPLPIGTLLTSGRLALICLQQFFRAAAYVFYTTQFPTYLRRARGATEAESGLLTSVPLLGVVGGAIAGGIAMDFILRKTGSTVLSRKGVAVAGALGGGAFLLVAYLSDNLAITLAFATASTFCAGMTGPAGYTITIDQGGKHVGTVFSIMNTAGNIGAWLMPIAVGYLVGETRWGYALLYVSLLYFAAAVCWLFLEVRGSIFPTESPRPDTRITRR